MRGAGLFFALPDEADVGLERDVRGLEGCKGGELSEDGGFVVAGSAGVDAGFAVDLFDDGSEGLAGVPLGGSDGLAVVVGVEDDGAFGAGSFDLAPDYGWGGGWKRGVGEEFGFGSALLELGDEEFGVAAEVGGVGGDVGDGEEVGELLGEFGLAWGCVAVSCLRRGGLGKENKWRRKDGGDQDRISLGGHEEKLACGAGFPRRRVLRGLRVLRRRARLFFGVLFEGGEDDVLGEEFGEDVGGGVYGG